MAMVAAVLAPLAEYRELFVALAGSFCSGSFNRLAAAAAPKLEIEIEPCIWYKLQLLMVHVSLLL